MRLPGPAAAAPNGDRNDADGEALRRPAVACKRGHLLAPPNLDLGVQRRFCKRLGQEVTYPLRVCSACRRARQRNLLYSNVLAFTSSIRHKRLVSNPFSLNEEEMLFLASHVKSTDTAFEWGTGESTVLLASRCRRVTSVEHQPLRAAQMLLWAMANGVTNLSVLSIPPDLPYAEGTDDDGDASTFRNYVKAYTGEGVDIVLIDGRSRVPCARQIVEVAQFGPTPETKVFIHDVDREQLEPIWRGDHAYFCEIARVGRLMLCGMKI